MTLEITKKGQRFLKVIKTPSLFGGARREIQVRKPLSAETIRKRKELAKQRQEAAINEILEYYKKGWPMLSQGERKSISSIATALLRKRVVTIYKIEKPVAALLVALAKAGKITIPPRLKSGGARKKKTI